MNWQEYWKELKFYWKSACSAFFRIRVNSEKGLPAYYKIIDTLGKGINPITNLPSELDPYGVLETPGKQMVAFYCEEDKSWWASSNSGYSWAILPSKEVFLKIIHLVDVVL